MLRVITLSCYDIFICTFTLKTGIYLIKFYFNFRSITKIFDFGISVPNWVVEIIATEGINKDFKI